MPKKREKKEATKNSASQGLGGSPSTLDPHGILIEPLKEDPLKEDPLKEDPLNEPYKVPLKDLGLI